MNFSERMFEVKYRKKPVVIEAYQFNNLAEWANVPYEFGHAVFPCTNSNTFKICTLEGEHIVTKGDWIIKGVKGEFYPCKPDIFEMTYEEVKE